MEAVLPGDPKPGSRQRRADPRGRTLHDPLVALQEWAQAHVDEVLDARDRYDQALDADVLRGV